MKKHRSISQNSDYSVPHILLLALFLLSSASLSYEINITRLFSVTQFYHFAFLIVSLALLGFGASGAFLVIFPNFGSKNIYHTVTVLSFFTGISFIGAYLVTNHVPFDSFSIALGWKYTGVLFLHMVLLSTPFFFTGLVVVQLINSYPNQVNHVYAINLTGSAFGCLLAMFIPNFLGAVGLVVICTFMALICFFLLVYKQSIDSIRLPGYFIVFGVIAFSVLMFSISELYLRLSGKNSMEIMQLKISPYKGISYALQYPSAEIIYQKWNAYSRIDLVRSRGIRLIPGFSYVSHELPPEQDGLFIDGSEPSPVFKTEVPDTIISYLPSSIAYDLRPNARTLILEPHGGMEIIIAVGKRASEIHSAEPNPLIVEAAQTIYSRDYLINYLESGRSYLKRSQDLYDVIVISLNSSFHPVRSGAYGLGEEYRYTEEAFIDAINHLDSGGFLVLTRWLQTPPSEWLRTFGIAVEAVERIGGDPAKQIAAFRSYNTGTLLIKNGALNFTEINMIKEFADIRAYDVVYFQGVNIGDVNKHNILQEPVYYLTFTSLLNAESRGNWYQEYQYQVDPPSDDRPFFNQYFKWSQLPQIIAEFGKVWQPFGGAGFIILLIMLALTLLLSISLILIPSFLSMKSHLFSVKDVGLLIFFAAIGLGFLFVEIPMIQKFILFLDNSSYSLTTVLFSILFFSGIGSRFAGKISINASFFGLLITMLFSIVVLRLFIDIGLGLPLTSRVFMTILLLAPTGFFMGMPFPISIKLLQDERENLIPWAWSINGTFSVVASVTAALLAISFGFRFVLIAGMMFYLFAWMLIRGQDIQIQPHSQ